MNANYIVLSTRAGAKGRKLNATMATIITISMANASSTSSATTAVAADKRNKKKSPPSARTRASSPDAYTASKPITSMTSAALIHATKRTNNNNSHAATKQQKHSRGDMCTTCHMRNNRWTSSESSCLAEPGTPSPVTKEQARKQRQQKIPCWAKFL
jgi:hypothetical protein